MRFFTKSGPCDPARHYTLPPAPRLQHARMLAEQGRYFMVHTRPRQTGKTTTLYLQRAVNGGGHVSREYGIGRGRIDLTVTKPYTGAGGKPAVQREVIELKVRRKGDSDPLKEALAQLDGYLYRFDLDAGVLMIFDRRPSALRKRPAPQFAHHRSPEGRDITVVTL